MGDQPADRVGYKNPPKDTRFRKGGPQPKRAKKKEGLIDLKAMLDEPVKIAQDGREKKVPLYEVAVTSNAKKAIKGDMKAAKFIIEACLKYEILLPTNFPDYDPYTVYVPGDYPEAEWLNNFNIYGPPPWPLEPDGLCRIEEHRDAAKR